MRWLIAAIPFLLGGGGLTLMSLAPEPAMVETSDAAERPDLSAVLSSTVTCPGDIHWPGLTLTGGDVASSAGPPQLTMLEGTLGSLTPSPAGLTMRIRTPDGSEEEATLVNPACVATGVPAIRPFIEAAWTSWLRPCEACLWTGREGSHVRLGLMNAQAGDSEIRPVVALIFEGCADTAPANGTAVSSGGTSTPPQRTRTAVSTTPTAKPKATSAASTTPSRTAAAGAGGSSGDESTEPCDGEMATETPPAPDQTPTVRAASPTPPAATPTPPPSSGEVTVLAYTAQVARGDDASITIQGPAGKTCEIRYETPSGTVSKAAGLSPKPIAQDGQASWTWGISSRTAAGTGSVSVDCDGASVSVLMEIV